uniref:Uncharacterized protein n=1 Tax=Manihot esculenta TaxID=3983 RepID=A0A251JXU5_MANES
MSSNIFRSFQSIPILILRMSFISTISRLKTITSRVVCQLDNLLACQLHNISVAYLC